MAVILRRSVHRKMTIGFQRLMLLLFPDLNIAELMRDQLFKGANVHVYLAGRSSYAYTPAAPVLIWCQGGL